MVHGKACCSGSRGDAELVVDGTEMTRDGTGAYDELLCYLSVGQPESHPVQDLHLSCCQTREIGCCVPGKDRCRFRGALRGRGRFSLCGECLFRGHGASLRPIGRKYSFANGTAGSSHPPFIGGTLNRRQRCSHRLSQGLCCPPKLCCPQNIGKRCLSSSDDTCYSFQTGGDLDLIARRLRFSEAFFIKHTCSCPVLLHRSDIRQL